MDVTMATNFDIKLADIGLPSFGTLAFRYRLEYQNVDGRSSQRAHELAYNV